MELHSHSPHNATVTKVLGLFVSYGSNVAWIKQACMLFPWHILNRSLLDLLRNHELPSDLGDSYRIEIRHNAVWVDTLQQLRHGPSFQWAPSSHFSRRPCHWCWGACSYLHLLVWLVRTRCLLEMLQLTTLLKSLVSSWQCQLCMEALHLASSQKL